MAYLEVSCAFRDGAMRHRQRVKACCRSAMGCDTGDPVKNASRSTYFILGNEDPAKSNQISSGSFKSDLVNQRMSVRACLGR